LQIKDKYYFASDVHLGLPVNDPQKREQHFVAWLDRAAQDAKAIFLLGDIFDFWCEYKKVVPKGFVRTLGKLAELTDRGVEIHFFPGNHDLWTFGYFADELGLQVHHRPLEINLNGKMFYLAHGDNVGKMDSGYRFLRSIFSSPLFQKCFSAIHPRWGVAFAHRWSRRSRLSNGLPFPFQQEKEQVYQFAQAYSKEHAIDYFIFGHRHTPVSLPVNEHSRLVILGEWIQGCEYAVFENGELKLTNN